jgi:phosphatidylglycerophosphatase A
MSRVALLISTFGYVGYFPIAPGTAGSLAAITLYVVVRWAGSPMVDVATMVLVLAAGVWAATKSERLLGGKDPGPVVIDEVLGMLITLAFLPLSAGGVIVGFFAFRIFDVIKPWPAAGMERLQGGWGVMLDDAVAGLYAHATVRLLAWGAPSWMLT